MTEQTASDRSVAPTRRGELVVHVLTSLHFGGVECIMEIIARHHRHSSYRHAVIALGHGGRTEERLRRSDMPVVCLGKRVKIPSLEALVALRKELRRMRPGIVHARGAEANFHGLLAARLEGIPIRIGEETGMVRHSLPASMVFRGVYCFAHAVVGISEAVRESVVDAGEVPRWKTRRIYNPVELPEAMPRAPRNDGRFRIGFVGRMDPVKNPGALITALARLRQAGIPAELWFVGDGPMRASLEEQARKLRVTDSVVFHGYSAEPHALTRQCDIYVQPSLAEGLGLALLEAMGAGLPVIATSVGGAPEFVVPGNNGWLVSPHDDDALVAALTEAYRNPPQPLERMGINARAAVLERFTPERYLRELDQLYDSALSVRGRTLPARYNGAP